MGTGTEENVKLIDKIVSWATESGVKILIALIILFVAFRVINWASKKIIAKMEKSKKLDSTLTKTIGYAIKIALKALVIVCLIGYLGIETSGISALIASLGVAVGFAINGTLSNLAGGIMILITRPFKLGDYISAQGSEGFVQDIRICNTKILTIDNKTVYLPNSALSTGSIVNFSDQENRRVDLDFSIAGNDPVIVRNILLDVCAKENLVLKDPAPFARVTDYGAGNGVKMTMRAWCKSFDYWDTYFALLDDVQKAFDEKGIVVPFNQLDVHLKNN